MWYENPIGSVPCRNNLTERTKLKCRQSVGIPSGVRSTGGGAQILVGIGVKKRGDGVRGWGVVDPGSTPRQVYVERLKPEARRVLSSENHQFGGADLV